MIIPTSSQISAAAALSATALMTAITSSQNPYPPYKGTLALNDPLSNNNKGYAWDVITDKTDSCDFRGGAYHVTESASDTLFGCTANSKKFNDLAYQVQMEIIKGDRGGIIFRSSATGNNFYYFNISKSGAYSLDVYNSQGFLKTLSSGTISAFQSGLNQTNLIAVVAQGHTIDLYVNLQFIAGVSDSSYGSGQIGVVADDLGSATEVLFSNAKVWKL
jgi:hypothetical protein